MFTSSSPPLRLLSQESAKEREILEVLKSTKVLPCMVNTHFWHTLLFRLEWAHLEDPHFQGPLLFLKVQTGHPSVKPKAHLSLCPALIRLLLFFPEVARFQETLMREYVLGRSSGILLNVWQQSSPLSAHFSTAEAL